MAYPSNSLGMLFDNSVVGDQPGLGAQPHPQLGPQQAICGPFGGQYSFTEIQSQPPAGLPSVTPPNSGMRGLLDNMQSLRSDAANSAATGFPGVMTTDIFAALGLFVALKTLCGPHTVASQPNQPQNTDQPPPPVLDGGVASPLGREKHAPGDTVDVRRMIAANLVSRLRAENRDVGCVDTCTPVPIPDDQRESFYFLFRHLLVLVVMADQLLVEFALHMEEEVIKQLVIKINTFRHLWEALTENPGYTHFGSPWLMETMNYVQQVIRLVTERRVACPLPDSSSIPPVAMPASLSADINHSHAGVDATLLRP